MSDDVLKYLAFEALQEVREERRRVVEITARRVASPQSSLRDQWEHEQAIRQLEAVEAEIAKRTSVF